MTLQQLEYIVALAEERNFVRAAKKCFVSQPGLTTQVKKLEEELGLKLFDRGKHPLGITLQGTAIVAQAREVLRAARSLKELASDDRSSLAGEFRLGIIPTLSASLLPGFLRGFASHYPETHLTIYELQTSDIVEKLKTDQLETGLLGTPLEENSIRELPVFNEPFYVYASQGHPLYQKKRVDANDLFHEDLLLLADGHCFRNQVLNLCMRDNKKATTLPYHYESGSLETLMRLVDNGTGYTLLPELMLAGYQKNPEVAARVKAFEGTVPSREVSLVAHESFPKERLLQAMREEILASIPKHLHAPAKVKRIHWKR